MPLHSAARVAKVGFILNNFLFNQNLYLVSNPLDLRPPVKDHTFFVPRIFIE
jgi:hypothetical protein